MIGKQTGSLGGFRRFFLVEKMGRTAYWHGPRAAIASSPLGDASRGARTWPLLAAASTLRGPAAPTPRAAGSLSRACVAHGRRVDRSFQTDAGKARGLG